MGAEGDLTEHEKGEDEAMKGTSRRDFIMGTAAIAAGAAVGLTALKGIRTHSPVEIRTFLFTTDPIVIQSSLYADDRRDVFGIRTFDNGKEACRVEVQLSTVRKSVASSGMTARCHFTTLDEEGDVSLVAKDGNLTFLFDEPGRPPSPVWMSLADVQRVL
jgi:hypothetical protein